MTSLAQTLHQYKAEEGVVVAFQTGHSFDWQTGESTPTVDLEQSRNGGESFTGVIDLYCDHRDAQLVASQPNGNDHR